MTQNDDAATQEWGGQTKTFDDTKTAAETVAFGEGLDDFDLEGGAAAEPKHAVMPARGQKDEGPGDGLLARFMAWLKGLFGGAGES